MEPTKRAPGLSAEGGLDYDRSVKSGLGWSRHQTAELASASASVCLPPIIVSSALSQEDDRTRARRARGRERSGRRALAGRRRQGCNSIDILGLAQFRAQVMFGVLRHVSTFSALVLNLAQNAAQFGAQDF